MVMLNLTVRSLRPARLVEGLFLPTLSSTAWQPLKGAGDVTGMWGRRLTRLPENLAGSQVSKAACLQVHNLLDLAESSRQVQPLAISVLRTTPTYGASRCLARHVRCLLQRLSEHSSLNAEALFGSKRALVCLILGK